MKWRDNPGVILLGVAVLAFGGMVLWKGGSGPPKPPALLPLPAGAATELQRIVREIDALRPPPESAPDPTVRALLARLGRFGALGADDLAEAEAMARGTAAALPFLLDIVGAPPPADAPRPKHAAVDVAQRLRRADAARLLGAIGDPRAIPALGALLDSADADPYVQEAAAEALGAIGDRAALVPLLAFLEDDRSRIWRVTIAAAQAALRLGAPTGGDELIGVITDWNPAMAKRPRVFDRERVVLQSLRPLAGTDVAEFDPYMLPPQLKQAGAKWEAWWEEYKRTQFRVPDGVTLSGPLLHALLRPHLEYFDGASLYNRRRAQRVIAGLGEDGLPYLFHQLRSPEKARRQYGAEALGETEGGEPSVIVPHLVGAWHAEAAPLVRVEIVRALRRLQVRGAVDPGLLRIVKAAALDLDDSVRDAATAPIPPR
ncbi:MAG: HEAT repeat domain-containing protein [Planctomycetota bacterium]